ncbi:MAG: sialidase family protein [Candidatus Zixiibacteriota bacterium]
MKALVAGLTLLAGSFALIGSVIADSNYPVPNNNRITNISQLNNEEQVFLSPLDSNIVIANWRDFRLGYRQIGIGRSTDGGQTWSDSLINQNMQFFFELSWQSDPTMTVDAAGNFYMSILDFIPGSDNESIIAFYKSIDQGLSWTGPVPNVSSLGFFFEDKQFITADRTGGPHNGNLYCSWTRFPNPDRIAFVRSIDGGASFQDTVIVGPVQTSSGCGGSQIDAGQFSIPVVSSNGDVHVFWQGFALDSGGVCSGLTNIKQVVSTDGGASFGAEDTVLAVSGWTSADGGISTYSQPAADADITGGPFNGNLYISFTNIGQEDPSNSDVDFIRSTDNGFTWSPRYQINDDSNSVAIDNFHPWLVVNDEGVIAVVFYDQREDAPIYFKFDLFAAYSFDGGLTFTSNHRISSVSSSPGNLKGADPHPVYVIDDNGIASPQPLAGRAGLLGEYIGLTTYHDKMLAVWTDSRDGNSEVYSATWYLPLLEPRLIVPQTDSYQPASPAFGWSTMWKHDQDRYRLEIATNSGFTGDIITRTLDTNSFAFDSTLAETTWFWRVKTLTIDGTDSSEYSPVWVFGVDLTPPEPATLMLPADGSATNSQTPLFDWADVSKQGAPVSYTLEISVDSTFPAGLETKSFDSLTSSQFTPPISLTSDTVQFWQVLANDEAGNSSTSSTFWVRLFSICGDVNGDMNGPDIVDLTYLVDYLFGGGSPPPILEQADIDGSGGEPDIVDLTGLVDHLFGAGFTFNCL